MVLPGDLSRADALKTRGMEAVRLMMGVALLLVVAANHRRIYLACTDQSRD
jgi:hypothetical protein